MGIGEVLALIGELAAAGIAIAKAKTAADVLEAYEHAHEVSLSVTEKLAAMKATIAANDAETAAELARRKAITAGAPAKPDASGR